MKSYRFKLTMDVEIPHDEMDEANLIPCRGTATLNKVIQTIERIPGVKSVDLYYRIFESLSIE